MYSQDCKYKTITCSIDQTFEKIQEEMCYIFRYSLRGPANLIFLNPYSKLKYKLDNMTMEYNNENKNKAFHEDIDYSMRLFGVPIIFNKRIKDVQVCYLDKVGGRVVMLDETIVSSIDFDFIPEMKDKIIFATDILIQE